MQSAFAPPEDSWFPARRLSYFGKSGSVVIVYYLCFLSILILNSVSRPLPVLRSVCIFLPSLCIVAFIVYKTRTSHMGFLHLGNSGLNMRNNNNEGFFVKWGEVSEFRVIRTLSGKMVEFDYRVTGPDGVSQIVLTRRLMRTKELGVMELAQLLNNYRSHYSLIHLSL
ncbi:MAG: hypothetical protein Q4A82_01525 [Corynebacterium sp.]|nr:hypothetical protein [Corynebacterium sp.]